MEQASSYQKVYYKGQEDPSNANLVNSLKFKTEVNKEKRKWSPHIAKEETFRKKRLREDQYSETIPEDKRIILTIQDKHVYHDIKNKELIREIPKEDEYYKVTKPTQVIPNVEEKLNATNEMQPRPTIIHRNDDEETDEEEPESINSIYKIQGIEFLPAGFLELDPMLFKNEYEFISDKDQEMFKEDQRKIKVQRRKQYDQRDKNRERKVVIFVADEYKDKLMDYFEKFTVEKKRKLNQDELQFVADSMQTNVDTISKLQDLYIDKKRQTHGKKLKKLVQNSYFNTDGELHEIPDILKKFLLLNNADALSDLGKSRKFKPKKKKKQPQEQLDPIPEDVVNENTERGRLVSAQFHDVTQEMPNPRDVKVVAVQSDGAPLINSQRVKQGKQKNEFSPLYYDSQISAILDKIRGRQPQQAEPRDSNLGIPRNDDAEMSNTKNLAKIKSLIDKEEDKIANDMDRLIKTYNLEPEVYKKWALTELAFDRPEFQVEGATGNEPVVDVESQGPKASAFRNHRICTLPDEKRTTTSYPVTHFTQSKLEEMDPAEDEDQDPEEIAQDEAGPRRTTKHQAKASVNPLPDIQEEEKFDPVEGVKSVTVVSKSHKNFNKFTDKFRSHIPKIDYFFEVISECFEVNKKKQFVITTLNQDMQMVLIDEVVLEDSDKVYESFFNGEFEKTVSIIILRNHQGEILEVIKILASEDLTDDQVDYMLGKKSPEVVAYVENVFLIDDDDRRGGKGRTQSMGMQRPKNITAVRPKAYSNFSNIRGLNKTPENRSGAQSLRGTGKISVNRAGPSDSNVGRPTDYSGLAREYENKAIKEFADGDGNNRSSKLADPKSSMTDGDLPRVSDVYNQMKEDGINDFKAQGNRLSWDGRPTGMSNAQGPRVTELYNDMKDRAINDLEAQNQDSGRLSNQTRPPGVSLIYNQMKEDQINEWRKRKTNGGEEAPAQDSDPKNSNQGNQKSPAKESENRVSSAKKSSMKDPKLSRFSQGGRPTNYSAFYEKYVSSAIDDSGRDVTESRKTTGIEPLSGTLRSKLSEDDRKRDSKLSQQGKSSNPKTSTVSKKDSVISQSKQSKLPEQIKHVLESENNEGSKKDLEKMEMEIKKQYDPKMIDEFYRFCREILPDDNRYKESILFVSLFYYFLETKNLLN